MSGNITKLIGFGVVWSILFFLVLNMAIASTSSKTNVTLGLITMVIYGLGFYAAASYFGKADDKAKVGYNVTFWYMFTGLATNLVGAALWAFGFAHNKTDAKDTLGSLAISYVLTIVGYLIITPIIQKLVKAAKKG